MNILIQTLAFVVFSALTNSAKYLANPGEFPFVVIITSENGTTHTGILTTQNTVISTWTSVVQYLSVSRDQTLKFHCTKLKILASNGDWQGDRKKQTRNSDIVCKHPNYRNVGKIPVNNVAVIILDHPFTITPYVVSISDRMGTLTPRQPEAVLRSLKTTSDVEDFVIGGLAYSSGEFESQSPTFRYTTKLISRSECEKAVCGEKCKQFDVNEENLICFEHGGIGGPGSPVLKDLYIVGIGSFVVHVQNKSFLAVTLYSIGGKMVVSVLSEGTRISFKLGAILLELISIQYFSDIYLISVHCLSSPSHLRSAQLAHVNTYVRYILQDKNE